MRQVPVKGQFKRCIRHINGIYLFFWTKDTVYAIGDDGTKRLYARFDGHVRSFYTNHWHKFVTYAKHGNGITFAKLNQKAIEHGLTITSPREMPIDAKLLPGRSKW